MSTIAGAEEPSSVMQGSGARGGGYLAGPYDTTGSLSTARSMAEKPTCVGLGERVLGEELGLQLGHKKAEKTK